MLGAALGHAAGLLPLKGSARAWLHEQQSRTEKKQQEHHPLRKNESGRPMAAQ
jgi:hypothetical protein